MISQALDTPMQVGAPDSVWGLAAVVAVQLLITAGGAVHTWASGRRQKTMRVDMRDVKENVVNGHGNLRADIDRLLELGEDNLTRMGRLEGRFDGLEHRVDQITRPHIQPAKRTGW